MKSGDRGRHPDVSSLTHLEGDRKNEALPDCGSLTEYFYLKMMESFLGILFVSKLKKYSKEFMQFFVPAAQDDTQAEQVYGAIAQFVAAPITEKRIWKLRWRHNGMDMQCEVGQPLPAYYQTGLEPVLAIFDCGNLYKICTPNRGGIRGEAVLAGKNLNSSATYFS